jgi:peptidoglycan hydrolase-like protein with peptidoglycan-binding domain
MVQQRLNALGYGPLAVDGDFGPVTRSWVVRYQSDYGLYVDGVVGPVTWRSMFA